MLSSIDFAVAHLTYNNSVADLGRYDYAFHAFELNILSLYLVSNRLQLIVGRHGDLGDC